MFFLFLVKSLFEGIEDHAVHPFDLAIGSRMGNRDVFDRDTSVFVEVPKMVTSECSSEVGDNAIQETESMDDIFEELDCLLCSSQNKRLVLNPLRELVNGNVHVPKTTWRGLERHDHVESPACKRLRSWDGLQFLCRHVYLLGEKLTSFTMSNEFFCVKDGHGLVKTSSKSLADQVSGGLMIATGTRVDFKE